MKPSCAAALVSGGPDSAVLVAWLVRRGLRVVPLYVRQGLRWERAEHYWLRRWLAGFPRRQVGPLVVVGLPVTDLYGAHWSVTGRRVPGAGDPDEAVALPGRNILLIAAAALYCAPRGIGTIALGTLNGNPFPDAGPAFRRAMGRALTLGLGAPVVIRAPLAAMGKAEVIRLGARWGVPWRLTFSCLSPRGRRPCGACQKCEERRRGFLRAGIAG